VGAGREIFEYKYEICDVLGERCFGFKRSLEEEV
jgi:hypothetical protein